MDRRAPKPSEPVANRPLADIDPALVDLALSGDAAANVELWRQIRILVINLAQIICRGTQDSDVHNVIQESLLALVRRRNRLGDIRNWSAYLRTVITNCIINSYREAHRRNGWVSLDAPVDGNAGESQTIGNLLPAAANLLEEVARNELRAILERFFDTLPKEQATVFRLHMQGCSYQEMAQKTGRPEGTVATWINRIKGEIRDWLDSSDDQRST